MSKIKSLKIKQTDGSYTTVALGANSVNIDMANGDTLETAMGKKQNTLTAGDNITITNNVISASSESSSVIIEEPIGTVKIWYTDTAPDGYLFLRGQAISRTTYSKLFELWGTTFGTGDGSTTFNLPDMRDYVPVGKSDTDTNINTIGKKYGAKTHTLTTAQMPSHNHSFTGVAHSHLLFSNVSSEENIFNTTNSATTARFVSDPNLDDGNNYYISTISARANSLRSSDTAAGGTVGNNGSGSAHNIMQPSVAVNYIVKAIDTIASLSQGSIIDGLDSNSTTQAPSVKAVNAGLSEIKDGTTLFSDNQGGTILGGGVTITLSETIDNFRYVEIEGWAPNHGNATIPFVLRFPCYAGINNRYPVEIKEWFTVAIIKVVMIEIAIQGVNVSQTHTQAYKINLKTLTLESANISPDAGTTNADVGGIHITAIRGYDRR